MQNQRIVFIPAYQGAAIKEIRMMLLLQNIVAVFFEEKYPRRDIVEENEITAIDDQLHKMACKAIEEFGGMVVPEYYKGFDEVLRLIEFCKNKYPVHIISPSYELYAPWKFTLPLLKETTLGG